MRTFLIALTVSALCGCSLYFDGEGERKGKLGGNPDAGTQDPCPDGGSGPWHPDGGSWPPDAAYGVDGGSFAFGPDGGTGGSDGGTHPCWEGHPDGGSWLPDADDVDGGVAPDAP